MLAKAVNLVLVLFRWFVTLLKEEDVEEAVTLSAVMTCELRVSLFSTVSLFVIVSSLLLSLLSVHIPFWSWYNGGSAQTDARVMSYDEVSEVKLAVFYNLLHIYAIIKFHYTSLSDKLASRWAGIRDMAKSMAYANVIKSGKRIRYDKFWLIFSCDVV